MLLSGTSLFVVKAERTGRWPTLPMVRLRYLWLARVEVVNVFESVVVRTKRAPPTGHGHGPGPVALPWA